MIDQVAVEETVENNEWKRKSLEEKVEQLLQEITKLKQALPVYDLK